MRTHLAAAVGCALVTVAFTWPLARDLGAGLPSDPRGIFQHACDPQLEAWTIDWDLRWLSGAMPNSLWDADIFYPARGVLTYSEHLIGAAMLAAPIALVADEPVTRYNALFIASFFLSALAAFLLAYEITGRTDAALVAGLVFGFCPFRYAHLSQLHLLNVYWTPAALFFAIRFLGSRSWPSLAGFVACVVMQWWSSMHYGAFLTVMLALLGPIVMRRARRDSAQRLRPAAAILVATLCVTQGPVLTAYWRGQRASGFHRTFIENVIDSADLAGYAAAPTLTRLAGAVTSRAARHESWLYPGTIATILAIGAFVWRRSTADGVRGGAAVSSTPLAGPAPLTRVDLAVGVTLIAALLVRLSAGAGSPTTFSWPLALFTVALLLAAWRAARRFAFVAWMGRAADPRTPAFWMLWTATAALLSWGPIVHAAERQIAYGPYALLYWIAPGVDGLRAPARFHMLVMLGIAVLAGFGASALADLIASGRRAWVASACLALIAIDYAPRSLPVVSLPLLRGDVPDARVPEVYRWLRDQPAPGAVVELPISPNNELWRECDRLYFQLLHRRPTANGYSGYFPAAWHRLRKELPDAASRVTEDQLRDLARDGVRFIVAPPTMVDESPEWRAHRLASFGGLVILERRAPDASIVP